MPKVRTNIEIEDRYVEAVMDRYGVHPDGGAGRARTDAREDDLRRLLLRFAWTPLDPVVDFAAAARIYRRCRRVGVTPRGLVDCLVAAVAWRTGATLLARDIDLHRVAEVIGVGLDPLRGR